MVPARAAKPESPFYVERFCRLVSFILILLILSDYRCICLSGFIGSRCQDDVDECLFDFPCRNGGLCINNFGGNHRFIHNTCNMYKSMEVTLILSLNKL